MQKTTLLLFSALAFFGLSSSLQAVVITDIDSIALNGENDFTVEGFGVYEASINVTGGDYLVLGLASRNNNLASSTFGGNAVDILYTGTLAGTQRTFDVLGISLSATGTSTLQVTFDGATRGDGRFAVAGFTLDNVTGAPTVVANSAVDTRVTSLSATPTSASHALLALFGEGETNPDLGGLTTTGTSIGEADLITDIQSAAAELTLGDTSQVDFNVVAAQGNGSAYGAVLEFSPIPEPSAAALIFGGATALLLIRRRR